MMNSQNDVRLSQLRNWLQQQLGNSFSLEPASADASFRRYFRVIQKDQSLIAMDAPPDKEDSHPFVRVAAYLEQMQLNAPRVLAENYEQGFFLLSDLGQQHYLSVLNPDNAQDLYQDAMSALLTIQHRGGAYLSQLPPYDEAMLLREMHLFRDWYLQTHLGIRLSDSQLEQLDHSFAYLAQQALQQPRVFVHRDYHSRNLMYVTGGNNNPGILDFQDAVAGPLTYDLVSLLRDCYIDWPREQVMAWVADYHGRLHAAGMFPEIDLDKFSRWFDLMGIQRQLKASGIFARLYHRDGKPGYLADIPRTLGYLLEVAPDYPALSAFLELLEELAVPTRLQQVNA